MLDTVYSVQCWILYTVYSVGYCIQYPTVAILGNEFKDCQHIADPTRKQYPTVAILGGAAGQGGLADFSLAGHSMTFHWSLAGQGGLAEPEFSRSLAGA